MIHRYSKMKNSKLFCLPQVLGTTRYKQSQLKAFLVERV